MLSRFLNKSVVVRRLRTTTGNKRAFYATATVECEIQNIDDVQINSMQGIASKTYKAWFDPEQTIQEGDVLTDQGTGKKYRVIGVERLGQGLGLQAEHLEIIMTKYTG